MPYAVAYATTDIVGNFGKWPKVHFSIVFLKVQVWLAKKIAVIFS